MPISASLSSALSGASRRTIGGAVLLTFLLVAILRAFFFSFFSIPSPSMKPTLLEGDYVVVWTGAANWLHLRSALTSGSHESEAPHVPSYTKGDVVVFRTPDVARVRRNYPLLVKRIAGVPDDTVRVAAEYPFAGVHVIPRKGQRLELSGESIEKWRTLIEAEGHRVYVRQGIVYIDSNTASQYLVENDYYYVEGDNAGNSFDSRYWGFITESSVIGTPLLVYWSSDNVTKSGIGSTDGKDSAAGTGSVRWSRIFTGIH